MAEILSYCRYIPPSNAGALRDAGCHNTVATTNTRGRAAAPGRTDILRLEVSFNALADHARKQDGTSRELNRTLLERRDFLMASVFTRKAERGEGSLGVQGLQEGEKAQVAMCGLTKPISEDRGALLSQRVKEERSATQSEFPFVAARMASATQALAEGGVAAYRSSSGTSMGDIWKELSGTIKDLESGNLSLFEDAFRKYMDLYQDIVGLLGQLNDYVHAVDDNKIELHCNKIWEKLKEILNKYLGEAGVIAESGSRDEALRLCEELGLDPKTCLQQVDGKWVVRLDLSNVSAMMENLPSFGVMEISVARFNTWKAGFDAHVSRLEEAMQRYGQKYTNSYSRYENYHKQIVSMIQAMADMLRAICQSF